MVVSLSEEPQSGAGTPLFGLYIMIMVRLVGDDTVTFTVMLVLKITFVHALWFVLLMEACCAGKSPVVPFGPNTRPLASA